MFSLLLILFILPSSLRSNALTRVCFLDIHHNLFILIILFLCSIAKLYLDVCNSGIIVLGIYGVQFWFADSCFISVKFSCIIFQKISWFLFFFFKPQGHQLSLHLTVFVLYTCHSLSSCFNLCLIFSSFAVITSGFPPVLSILFFIWVDAISFSCF